jgi:hypothetical protein
VVEREKNRVFLFAAGVHTGSGTHSESCPLGEVQMFRYRHVGAKGRGVLLLLILNLGTRWSEWSTSRPDRAVPPGRDAGTHCTGDWVGLRAVWTQSLEGKLFASVGDRTPIPVVQIVVSYKTD